MKILFVAPAIAFGGAERVISILSNEWTKQGHKVYIISMDDQRRCAYSFEKAVEIDYISSAVFEKRIDILKTFKDVTKAISFRKPDVIISFISSTAVFSIPYALFTRTPLIYSERNDPNQIKDKKARWFQKMALKFAKQVVFQTEKAKEYYNKNYLKKSTVICNPFDANLLPQNRWTTEKRKQIVTVGRLTEQKNQKLLIEAFSNVSRSFPEYKLIIYGEGNLRKELEDQAKRLQIDDRVIFPGEKKNVLELIDGSCLFVLTSDYEGIPNALIEAMALGIPCISTDCSPGGARALIDDGVNGYIVPCGSVEELSAKIEYLLNCPDQAIKVGEEATRICQKLSPERIALEWIGVFKKAAGK